MALPIVNSSRYTTTIPSTGVEVEYRPYLVKEEKILMIAMESKDNVAITKAVKDVIKACVIGEVDVNRLATFDLEFLFLKLRAKSVGEVAEISLKCVECDHPNEVSLNLDKLEVKGLTEGQDNVIQITDTVGITMRYPSVSDVSGINPEDLGKISVVMKLIVGCMENIFDADAVYACKDETTKSVQDFLDSLNSAQFKKIAEFLQQIPAISETIQFTCTECKHENELELRGLESFFS
jgi:hypothetical protein